MTSVKPIKLHNGCVRDVYAYVESLDLRGLGYKGANLVRLDAPHIKPQSF
jgi:hypothetical protein